MKRILVVDNDTGVCQMLKTTLEDLNFSVSTAESGSEALEIYRSQVIDFVLLDVRMGFASKVNECVKIKTLTKAGRQEI